MAETQARKALIQGVINANANIPIKWENAAFTMPSNSAWAAVYILTMDDAANTLGQNGLNRIDGVMQISVFAPKGSGDLSAYINADKFRAIFKTGATLTADGQVVRISSASMRAGADEPNWYSQILNVEFYAYKGR